MQQANPQTILSSLWFPENIIYLAFDTMFISFTGDRVKHRYNMRA